MKKQKQSEISHHLPIKPISVNTCWQGRRFRTKEYKQWQNDMLKIMPKEKMIEGLVKVELLFGVKSILVGDLDNKVKPVLDSCVARGWIKDDRYIQRLEVLKVKQKEESISVFIESLDDITKII